jgi:isopentenyl-diphosphate delta-isomerase
VNKEMVILVDEYDNPLGLMEKIRAHEKGFLHRAFSVFLINDSNQLLIQRRALNKYHSPGLWTNTCCSHPRDRESIMEAANRRLYEEMGIIAKLKPLLSFIYKAKFDNGLTEHEFDHVVFGKFDGEPNINHNEVSDWKWQDIDFLKSDLVNNPINYTAWFKIIFEEFYNKIKNESNS